MDSYKNFTGHRYQCILSKYRAIFPRWLHLSHIFDGFEILSASWWPPLRTCPKVIISRLIPVTTGAIAIAWQNAGNSVYPRVIISRLIPVGDDGGKMARKRR